jgi:alkylation response protein AidB-like acyl-CoA dehydrogenase
MELHELGLTEDDLSLRKIIRSLVDKEIRPRAREIDETESFPADAMKALADMGLFGVLTPQEYGGGDGTMLQYSIITEEIARACAATSTSYITQIHGMLPIQVAGSEEQKSTWLPSMCEGSRLGAIAITEPDAGTDIHSMSTRAVRDGDDYVITGQKMFITNGGKADVIALFARTGEDSKTGISIFLVETDSTGFTALPSLPKSGIRGSNTVPLSLDSVRVPARNRLGEEGIGFHLAVTVLSDARLSTAAQAVGIAQGAWDIAYSYVQQREAFGHPVSEFQAVQLRLAEMYGPLTAARLLTYQVARLMDAKGRSEYSVETALAKQYCGDIAMNVASQAVQLMGGYGYMREYEAERFFRDAKITQIYDGTNDVNRLVMMRQLMKRDAQK